MATLRQIQSPGVQINEIDISTTANTPNGTSIFMAGFAAQGPASEIINITTNQDFANIFGTPTNAAERYLYYSVQQVFSSGTNAQVSVYRLPYGTGLGNGYNSNVYTALVYPVIAASLGTTALSTLALQASAINTALAAPAASAQALSTASTYFFAQPTLIELSQSDYNSLKQNGVSWSTVGAYNGSGLSAINALSSLNLPGIGMVVINEAQTTINEKFEGLYVNLADNTNLNPNTNFTAANNLYSIAQDNGLGAAATYTTVPATRYAGSFQLSSVYTDNSGSISQVIENIPQYDISVFGNGGFNDLGILSVFKVRTSPFGTNPYQLTYNLAEGYATSFYSNRTIQDVNGGAPQNDFVQNVVNNKSANISVLVNPNISNNTAWLDANGNAVKSVRIITQSIYSATSSLSGGATGYFAADNLYPLGVYSPSLNTTTNKVIGNVTGKLQTALNLAANADVYNIDVVADAGLSTIAAYSLSTVNTTGIFESSLFNSQIQSANNYLTTSDGTFAFGNDSTNILSTWNQVTQQFVQFTTNVRKDCLFISDPLRSVFVQGANYKTLTNKSLNFSQAIYWPLNNLYSGINSSYAATYGNWVQLVDQFTSQPIWVPFSAYAAAAFAANDAVAYPWGAPAGLNRGAITGITDIAINPQQKQRDLLYKISVNPVVNFPNEGFTIYGQKTLLQAPSAFDRINVRRLFLFLEKSVLNTTKFFVFEPNTTFTQNRLVNTIKPVFDLAKNTQGLYDYLIVCNNTNNTPSVVDDNSLVVDIYIKPVRTAEFILVNFYATKTSQNFNELLQ